MKSAATNGCVLAIMLVACSRSRPTEERSDAQARTLDPPVASVTVLARDQAHPRAVALAGDHAYFTVYEEGVVRRVSLSGGEPVTIAEGLEDAEAIAIDGTSAYVTTKHPRGVVARVPL